MALHGWTALPVLWLIGCSEVIGANFDRSPFPDSGAAGATADGAGATGGTAGIDGGAGADSAAGNAGAGGDAGSAIHADPVALGIESPSAIAVGGGSVYWISSNSPVLKRVDLAGGFPSQVTSEKSSIVAIAADTDYVYWASGSSEIWRAPPSGVDPFAVVGPSDCWRFPLLSRRLLMESGQLYWFSMYGIASVSAAGGTPNLVVEYRVLTGGDGLGSISDFAVDGTKIYWADLGDPSWSRVYAVPHEGGEPTVLASLAVGEQSVSHIAVDTSSVYIATSTGAILRVPKVAGGDPVPLYKGGLVVPVVDSSGLYWTDSAAGTVTMAQSSSTGNVLLVTGQNHPDSIAVNGCCVVWANVGTGGLTASIMKGTKPVLP